ncbi:hypothetical protein C8J57DRAFT_1712776 [Mycena rebaudengoi]|nr:hypothetical protein C8J57DRAFT_1712776 [Mycena rebaudengoi]
MEAPNPPSEDAPAAVDPQDIFTSSLLNPNDDASLCILGFANCCEKILKPRPLERPHKVLRAGMRFLGSDRSFEEHGKLTASVETCDCNMANPVIAKMHEKVSTMDPLNFTILELCFLIMDAISEEPGYLLEAGEGVASSEQPWPSALSDIFPSAKGCAGTLQNLLLWTAEPCGGSGVFLLISRLSEYSPEFSMAVFKAPMAMPCALVHLEQALDRYKAKEPPETYRLAIASCTHFLHHMDPKHFVRLLHDFKDLLLGIATRIQPALKEMPGPEAEFGKQWWSSLLIGLQAGEKFRWDKFGLPDDPVVEVDNAGLYTQMRALRGQKLCMNPKCPDRAEPSKETMFCKKCGIARYCGAPCIKQAWKQGYAPHRLLCNSVHALRQTLALETESQWREVMQAADAHAQRFAHMCEVKGVEAGVRNSLVREIARLGAAMSATIED